MTSPRGPLLLVGLLGVALASACSSGGAEGPNETTGGGGGAGSGQSGAGAGSSSGGGSTGGAGAASASAGSGGGASVGQGGMGAGGTDGAGNTGGMGSDEEYPVPGSLPDEDGAALWLRYPELPIPERLAEYQAAFKRVVKSGSGASLDIAEAELVKGLGGLTGGAVETGAAVEGPGAVVIGTATADLIKDLPLAARLGALGPEGYLVEAADVGGQPAIVVAGNTEVGVLYGAFALLRHAQTHSALAGLPLTSSPRIKHRILNHWDNLDRSVERGYAGRSIWDWSALPGTLSPRYKDYARANASLGINGTVLTNVNANAQVLTPSYLVKVKALADVFRPYGIKVYLTARFSAPREIGNLSTADPTNASVKQWWTSKVNEIYQQIPDFGGFLVKANSEGQPGPQDYGRTHADGANMLADAVAPHGGIVMWRAFVYSDASPPDRIKEAYEEFKPLDGKFRDNVLVQAKNGPLDFQPREPFHPLFGAMPETPLALELQITKEYLGEDTHLAYLGPLYEEVLAADTYADGEGSTVARVIDGSLHGHETTAIAGVSNVGDDVNWTGSHMNQANWYVFGRMAWNPDSSAETIAEEWVRQTFSNDRVVVEPVVQMMMGSHQALVDYMTPLGLVHIMGSDHHYGPAPWVSNLGRAEWNPVYYHKADANGIGFDRTSSGSNAVAQYFAPVGQAFGSRDTVSDDFLLFFHRVGWKDELSSGRTLWEELVHRYSHGVDEVAVMREAWKSVEGRIDDKRFAEVADFLEIQHYEARWWRDACLAYFGQVSKLQVPSGYAPLASSLSFYQGLRCPANAAKPRCSQVYTGDPSPAILP
ncbi:alpha-glucuronidase [Sorangium cellulosum]|uniref:Xylan alpha-1,2-glucuronidase n=1 Tax=Sorangium cellulosum TaxID=56 RepID=A0A4P2PYN2_SORCE|nr:alpha-glucuronidase family glycosyl hydrolase [Sorangium cellulosum]AUX21900.1 alpha-glucuronidase [Sorangium cellulosum]